MEETNDFEQFNSLFKQLDYYINLADIVYSGTKENIEECENIQDIICVLEKMCSVNILKNPIAQLMLSNYLNNALQVAMELNTLIFDE